MLSFKKKPLQPEEIKKTQAFGLRFSIKLFGHIYYQNNCLGINLI